MNFDINKFVEGNDSFKVNHIHSLLKEKGLTIGDTHDQYWELRQLNNNCSHIDAYSLLVFSLFEKVVNWSTDTQLTIKVLHNDKFLWNDIRDFIIIALFDEQNILDPISELVNEYHEIRDCDKFGAKYLISIISCESIISIPLNSDQKLLQKVFYNTSLRIIPKYKLKWSRKRNDVAISMSWEESYFPPNNYQEQLYQLYLVGDKLTKCSSYMGLLDHGIDNNNLIYDHNIIQFWKWAQSQKASYTVPEYLKEFCVKVLNYVAQNNSVMNKRSKDFNIYNIQDGWDKFRWLANDARKRLRKNESKL